ncbi:MAG: acyl-CoA thioesterase [Gemmatimonadales bacterium]|nr:MAG: acyl-CoA thioesterase [Gemmatimonadales bacterium]
MADTSAGPPGDNVHSAPWFTSRVRVRSYELDALGHVNHAVYLNYLEQARFDALEAAGVSLEHLSREGWGVHVVRIEVDYRAECRMGDELVIRTRATGFRNSSMTIRQTLARRPRNAGTAPAAAGDEVTAVDAHIVAVWVGPDGRPMRIPPPVRSALSGSGSRPDESDPPPM